MEVVGTMPVVPCPPMAGAATPTPRVPSAPGAQTPTPRAPGVYAMRTASGTATPSRTHGTPTPSRPSGGSVRSPTSCPAGQMFQSPQMSPPGSQRFVRQTTATPPASLPQPVFSMSPATPAAGQQQPQQPGSASLSSHDELRTHSIRRSSMPSSTSNLPVMRSPPGSVNAQPGPSAQGAQVAAQPAARGRMPSTGPPGSQPPQETACAALPARLQSRTLSPPAQRLSFGAPVPQQSQPVAQQSSMPPAWHRVVAQVESTI